MKCSSISQFAGFVLVCPPGFKGVLGHAPGKHFIIEDRQAETMEMCASLCVSIGPHCLSFIWSEEHKWCSLDWASEYDIDPNDMWNKTVTCVRGKK